MRFALQIGVVYVYTCPACGWTGDRIVKYVERDMQRCEESIPTGEGESIQDSDGEWYDDEIYYDCGARLVREEISTTAAMPAQWAAWRGRK